MLLVQVPTTLSHLTPSVFGTPQLHNKITDTILTAYLLSGLVLSCRPGNCPSVSRATAYTTSLSPSATHNVCLADTAAVATVTDAVKFALAVDRVATAVSTSCAVGSGKP